MVSMWISFLLIVFTLILTTTRSWTFPNTHKTRLLSNYASTKNENVEKIRKISVAILFSGFLANPLSSLAGVIQQNSPSIELSSQTVYPLSKLLNALNNNEISKVVFMGAIPKIAVVYPILGDSYKVELPYDDPKSPSGPAQVIARVQHAPGVVCMQDMTDVMSKLSRPKQSYKSTMLSSSAYPKTYADRPDGYTGGEDKTFLNRYNGKDSLSPSGSIGFP